MNLKNAYKLLKLDPSCTDDDIKKRFRELSKVHHPDMGGSQRNFNILVEAKDLLLRRKDIVELNGRVYDRKIYEDIIRKYEKAEEELREMQRASRRSLNITILRISLIFINYLFVIFANLTVWICSMILIIPAYIFAGRIIDYFKK